MRALGLLFVGLLFCSTRHLVAAKRVNVRCAQPTCLNGGTCTSPAWGCGVCVTCLCPPGFTGTLCESGSGINDPNLPSIFYPFGTSVGDSVAPVNDDGYTNAITIVGFQFFGTRRTQVFVSTNGAISFDAGISTYTPLPFPLSSPPSPMIAVYWADVDTRMNNGRIYYRQSTDSALLARATRDIRQANIPGLGTLSTFQASWLFIATWHNVTYYGGSSSTPIESFQAVLITDGTYSFAMFNYGTLTWTTGTASGGSASTGLGGTPAQVGFNAGDSVNYYAVPSSRTADIKNIWTSSNIGTTGRWIFRIDGASIAQPPINYCQSAPCLNGGTCTSTSTGFLCACPVGKTGTRCEITNYCLSAPCLNGGTCTSTTTGFLCTCPPRKAGNRCQTTCPVYCAVRRRRYAPAASTGSAYSCPPACMDVAPAEP